MKAFQTGDNTLDALKFDKFCKLVESVTELALQGIYTDIDSESYRDASGGYNDIDVFLPQAGVVTEEDKEIMENLANFLG